MGSNTSPVRYQDFYEAILRKCGIGTGINLLTIYDR